MQAKPIPVITGATATGKTTVAVELCRLINGEIISADSMQVYKHLSIGTAKPTPQELAGVPCHLIDHVGPNEQYHLGRFVDEANQAITEIVRRGKVPVICGGTGLYIRGLLYGIFSDGERNPELRAELERRVDDGGLENLFIELTNIDPASAAAYGPNDRQRIVRALEIYHTTGKALSAMHSQDFNRPCIASRVYVLSWPRDMLYERINNRVSHMLEQGLLEEIRTYLADGYDCDNPAIRAVGYTDLIDAMENRCSMDDAIKAMKQKSRNYAKRQNTWFRSMKDTIEIDCAGSAANDLAQTIADDWEKLSH